MMILRYSRLDRSVQYESVSLTKPLKHVLTRQALPTSAQRANLLARLIRCRDEDDLAVPNLRQKMPNC
jgi:hypothetical protein